jgi:hypothetical protein
MMLMIILGVRGKLDIILSFVYFPIPVHYKSNHIRGTLNALVNYQSCARKNILAHQESLLTASPRSR